ncbi:hypothetical protein D3C81_1720090 [compost metagenome]
MLCVGSAVPQSFLDFLALLQTNADNARAFFHAQGQQLVVQNHVRVMWRQNDLNMQQSAEQMNQAASILEDLDKQVSQLHVELRESNARNAQLKQELDKVTSKA